MKNKNKRKTKLEREWNQEQEYDVVCKHCGHKVAIYHKKRVEDGKVICSWCKHYVFADDKVEFKFRLKERINKCNWGNF